MAIRCKNTYNGYPNRTNVRISDLQILANSAPCKWTLYRLPGNANITGGSWTSLGSESAVEYNATVGTGFTLTGGYAKSSGWIAANNPSGKQASGTIGLDPTTSRGNFIAQNIDSNDSNIFAVIVQNLTTNTVTDVYCSLQWRETR